MSDILENMEIAITAINKWNFFCWNYEMIEHRWIDRFGEVHFESIPKFMVKVRWTCNFEHMLSKWKAASKTNDPMIYLPRFYASLDRQNCRALLEWIIMNYRDEKSI